MNYEFKGTPGKWSIKKVDYYDGEVSYDILSDMEFGRGKWIGEALIPLEYGGTEQECLANALLMSKSKEMFEMLKRIYGIENGSFGLKSFDVKRLKSEIEQLLKEATEI